MTSRERENRMGFVTHLSVGTQFRQRQAAPQRETAPTRSPGYVRSEEEPSEEDLKKMAERKERYPEIPPDLV